MHQQIKSIFNDTAKAENWVNDISYNSLTKKRNQLALSWGKSVSWTNDEFYVLIKNKWSNTSAD